MSFMNAEVAQPYKSLMYSYPEEDARLDADASRRAREFGAQSAASRGGGASPRGAAQNTYNRITSDYTLGKAQQDRNNRLAYTQVMANTMSRPGAVTPSTASTLAGVGGTIGASLLKEASPDLWRKAKESWWDSSPQQLSEQYTSNLYGGGPAGMDLAGNAEAGGYAGMGMGGPGGYGDMAAGAMDAYQGLGDWVSPAIDYGSSAFDVGDIWSNPDAFNFDFGNVWGL